MVFTISGETIGGLTIDGMGTSLPIKVTQTKRIKTMPPKVPPLQGVNQALPGPGAKDFAFGEQPASRRVQLVNMLVDNMSDRVHAESMRGKPAAIVLELAEEHLNSRGQRVNRQVFCPKCAGIYPLPHTCEGQ